MANEEIDHSVVAASSHSVVLGDKDSTATDTSVGLTTTMAVISTSLSLLQRLFKRYQGWRIGYSFLRERDVKPETSTDPVMLLSPTQTLSSTTKPETTHVSLDQPSNSTNRTIQDATTIALDIHVLCPCCMPDMQSSETGCK